MHDAAGAAVEYLLAARGVIVSHQTVRLWAEKFAGGPPVSLATSGILMSSFLTSWCRAVAMQVWSEIACLQAA